MTARKNPPSPVHRTVCKVYRCGRDQEWKVLYRVAIRNSTIDEWAKVCAVHATDKGWPVTWGFILGREYLGC